jgi:hypothetical protein
MIDEIVCGLSGITPTPDEVAEANTDGNDVIPNGWIRVTIERRYLNPLWTHVQAVKQSLVQATLQQIPEDQHEAQAPNVMVQVDAQYHALESTDKYKRISTDKEEIYIAPPESDEDIMEEYLQLLDLLGLEDEDSEEEDDEASEEEPDGTDPEVADEPEDAAAEEVAEAS